MFDSFEIRKALIIAPLRVGKNTWPAELKKWDHLNLLKMAIAIGDEETRIKALKSKADIYVINRENVQWLISLVESHQLRFDFDAIVVDELSSFKNGRAKRFQSLLKVRALPSRIIGLTGTPSPNSLMDLWAEYRLLDGGKRLGRYITHFRTMYFTPGRRNGNIVYNYIPLAGAEEAIYDEISDITISMKAIDHLKMPKLIKTEYPVYLSDEEFDKYQELAKEMALEIKDKEITAANAAVLTGKLLQIANGAIYEEKSDRYVDIHERKLDALEDIIEQANGKPILVAYWFKHDLERIVKRLSTIKEITFEEIKSDESIRRWNNKEITVGLIHPASAGHGLNLQEGGNTIVWFSQCFSLEAYQQTNARLYRQGQSEETVVVIHIVADKTMDSYALKVLEGKTNIQDALIDAVKAKVGDDS